MKRLTLLPILLLAALGTVLPGQAAEGGGPDGPAAGTPVTVVSPQIESLTVTERSIGWLESRDAPTVSAEVAGAVETIQVDVGQTVEAGAPLATLENARYRHARDAKRADGGRVKALVGEQERTVRRLRNLLANNAISQDKVDQAEAQLAALRGQYAVGMAELAEAERQLDKTRITAPISGRIEARWINQGDYAQPGARLFQIVGLEALRGRFPFPESLGGRLHPGLDVAITTPVDPGRPVQGWITSLLPSIQTGSRALEAIVEFANPGGWRPGGSLDGVVTLAVHPEAVTVPEMSVVLRPAGEVVYVLAEQNRVRERPVRSGLRIDGRVEILEGLQAEERIVADGAGFLTDGALIRIRARVGMEP